MFDRAVNVLFEDWKHLVQGNERQNARGTGDLAEQMFDRYCEEPIR